MTIKIVVFITPEQQCIEEMTTFFSELRAKTIPEEGCLQFDFYQHQQDFVLIEEWQDQEAIDQHMLKDYTQNFIKASDGKVKQTSVYRLQPI